MSNKIMSKSQTAAFGDALRNFHENERGDNENLGRMLVLGLILVPIVLMLVFFGDEIATEVKTQWDDVIGKKGTVKKT